LVHVEENFRKYFPDTMYVPRLIRSCKAHKYDVVIHCTSGIQDMSPIPEIADLVDEEIEWGWGYEPDMFHPDDAGEEAAKWLIESHYSLHEWTWVPPEFWDGRFKDCVIHLGGGCYCECMADMAAVLEYVGIEFYIVDGLTYGLKNLSLQNMDALL